MPRPKLTKEQYDAMRERILDAARGLLFEEGPEGITIRAVAARLGVSPMTLYTYYDSHAALLSALKQRQRARIQAHFDAELRLAHTGDVAQATREALERHVRLAKEHPRVFQLLWVLPPGDKESHNGRSERMAAHLRHLSQLVELGIERGVFFRRDPLLAAATAFSTTIAPLLLFHSGHLASEDLCDTMVAEAMTAALAYLSGPDAPCDGRTESEKEIVCSHSNAC